MLNITDLTSSKELKRDDMAGIRGGFDPFAILDSSTRINSKVADITQGFEDRKSVV